MTIDDITTKIENQGATPQGRLSAEELNTIVEQVKANRDTVAATGMSISGTLNLSQAATAVTMAAVYAALGNNQMRFYLVTDADGGFTGGSVTAAGAVAKLFGKDSLGVSVGDICVIAKLNSLPVYRILPLNDAKAASGDFPGADGLETIWDKTQVNKIPGIETTANEARRMGASAYMPSLGEQNMNNALQPGVYPWCTLGRPNSSTGAYTCIVRKSYNADGGGYYTIEQTAYGREGELGQVYKRIIFQKNDGSDTQYGEWIRVSGGEPIIYKLDIETNTNGYAETTYDVYNKLMNIAINEVSHRHFTVYLKIRRGEDQAFFTGVPSLIRGYSQDILAWMLPSCNDGICIVKLYIKNEVPTFEMTFKLI
ncbi:hypothetical protein [Prevotella sp. P3-122]|uniref:hypothetical protein n=1 Tax=Prevotella sp. P3-122 TaxID=2024223 RepID=UPI000B96AA79|nr:hypothetical protein [Prevotella sp. P3-122]OYP60435.1 hypothetical protein CIL02_08330 [Prevotella sp. P3-122]